MSASTSAPAPRRTPTPPSSSPPPGTNVVVLRGVVSRRPEERVLPSGATVLAFDVTVRVEGQPAESVPVSLMSPPAAARRLVPAQEVVVVGRVRRRFFRAGGATASRTEVVAERVVPASATARVRAALGRVVPLVLASDG